MTFGVGEGISGIHIIVKGKVPGIDTAVFTAAVEDAHRYFAPSLPSQTGPEPDVELENGLGTPGLVPAACRELTAVGFNALDGGNASAFSHGHSQVLIRSRSAASTGLGDRVAVHAVCRENVFWETLEQLKGAGASSVLVLPVEKMLA